jgi:hypothetical protein
MKLHGWEAKLLGNLSVLDLASFLQRETFDSLGHVRTGSDGTPTTKRLELDVGDDPILIDTDLKLHNVAAAARGIYVSWLVTWEHDRGRSSKRWCQRARRPKGRGTYAGAPTRPVPTSTSFLGNDPTCYDEEWGEKGSILSDKGPRCMERPRHTFLGFS